MIEDVRCGKDGGRTRLFVVVRDMNVGARVVKEGGVVFNILSRDCREESRMFGFGIRQGHEGGRSKTKLCPWRCKLSPFVNLGNSLACLDDRS